MKTDMINASCAFSRLKGRPVVLHILKTVSSKSQLTGLYSMRLFGLTDDQCDELLIFEHEKYTEALGTYELLDYLKMAVIQVSPSQGEIDVCAAFFPESELSDIVHAATCLYADATLITNDHHFDRVKEAGIVEVWSSTKAIKRLLDGVEDYEDSE